MGLIKEGEHVRVLSDILGDEDHLGDMDFKVAGTAERRDLAADGHQDQRCQPRYHAPGAASGQGRAHAYPRHHERDADRTARTNVSGHAPRIITIKVRPEKIREIIGPGGKVIRGIIEATGVKMDVEDDGTVTIASIDEAAARKPSRWCSASPPKPRSARSTKARCVRSSSSAPSSKFCPAPTAWCTSLNLLPERVRKVSDVLKEGDEVMVKVLEIDRQGKIRLEPQRSAGGNRQRFGRAAKSSASWACRLPCSPRPSSITASAWFPTRCRIIVR